MPEHGGKLRAAAAEYNIPLEQWLDLSTGINPIPWPIPEIPQRAWHRLPEDDDGLNQIACRYYGCQQLLAVAGSQMAIQALPRLRAESKVGMLHPTYNEHQHHWRLHGHQVVSLEASDIDQQIESLEVLLLVNPNNPTAERFTQEQLLGWHAQLARRGGWLIVDEAFIDSRPENSLAGQSHLPGLIILRSFGKFFGLAGARIGFVCANGDLLAQLSELVGPWALSGPARHVAMIAMQDSEWQQATRIRLSHDSQRLVELLTQLGLSPTGHTDLFCWIKTEQAQTLHQRLAQEAVFTRLFAHPASLRFGLPGNEAEWQQLSKALEVVCREEVLK